MQVHSPPCARGRSQLYKLRNEEQRERKRIHAAAEGAREQHERPRRIRADATIRVRYGAFLFRPMATLQQARMLLYFVVS